MNRKLVGVPPPIEIGEKVDIHIEYRMTKTQKVHSEVPYLIGPCRPCIKIGEEGGKVL